MSGLTNAEHGDRWDVMIVTTGGEEIHRRDLPGDVAAGFEDLPFTSPENVAVVQVKQAGYGEDEEADR